MNRRRPEDPVDFLKSCLQTAKSLQPDQIVWDTFLRHEDPAETQPTPKIDINTDNGIVSPLPDLRKDLPGDWVPVEKSPSEFHISNDCEQKAESATSSLTMASPAKKARRYNWYSSSPSTSVTTSSDGADFSGMSS